MQSGYGSSQNHAAEQTKEWYDLIHGHPALLRLRSWMAVNDPIRLSMQEAAGLACVELHYFSAIFRKHTGRSFIEWRRSIRIARAAHLIIDGTLTVQQIAYAVGYKDRRSLERALRQLRNMSPSALRSRELHVSAEAVEGTEPAQSDHEPAFARTTVTPLHAGAAEAAAAGPTEETRGK